MEMMDSYEILQQKDYNHQEVGMFVGMKSNKEIIIKKRWFSKCMNQSMRPVNSRQCHSSVTHAPIQAPHCPPTVTPHKKTTCFSYRSIDLHSISCIFLAFIRDCTFTYHIFYKKKLVLDSFFVCIIQCGIILLLL